MWRMKSIDPASSSRSPAGLLDRSLRLAASVESEAQAGSNMKAGDGQVGLPAPSGSIRVRTVRHLLGRIVLYRGSVAREARALPALRSRAREPERSWTPVPGPWPSNFGCRGRKARGEQRQPLVGRRAHKPCGQRHRSVGSRRAKAQQKLRTD